MKKINRFIQKVPFSERRLLHIKHLVKLCEKRPSWLEVKLAKSLQELIAAYRLLHDVYVEAGYMHPHPSRMRISKYNLLPRTITFIAKIYDEVVGTVTLIEDSKLGLPMEEIYPKEIESLRKTSFKLAEVSGLAVDKYYRFKKIFWYLNYHLAMHALLMGITDLVIAVNPKHLSFYRNFFMFQVIGPKRYYAKVNGAPAVAMHLNLKELEKKSRRILSLSLSISS